MNSKIISICNASLFMVVLMATTTSNTMAASPSTTQMSLRGGHPTNNYISSSIIGSAFSDNIATSLSSAIDTARNLLYACEVNVFERKPFPIEFSPSCESAYFPMKCARTNEDGKVIKNAYTNKCFAAADGWSVVGECSLVKKCAGKGKNPYTCNGYTFHNKCLAKRSGRCNLAV